MNKNTATSGKLITAVYTVMFIFIVQVSPVSWSIIDYLLAGEGGVV